MDGCSEVCRINETQCVHEFYVVAFPGTSSSPAAVGAISALPLRPCSTVGCEGGVMSKTTLAVVTAAAVSALSLALILGRWYVLGDEIDGTPGTAVWRVAVEVEGEMTAPDASITTVLPPDFRGQHILDETFDSPMLAHKVSTARDGGARRAGWK